MGAGKGALAGKPRQGTSASNGLPADGCNRGGVFRNVEGPYPCTIFNPNTTTTTYE